MVIAVTAGVGLASAAVGAYSSSQASGAASKAANQSAKLQQEQAYQSALRLDPYNTFGVSAGQQLQDLNTKGFNNGGVDWLSMANSVIPTANNMGDLTKTPGYQFNLQQGLQATQNAAAAKGLGVSGAALKGAATYATGLADSTYQNQFNNQQTKYQDYMNLNTGQQANNMNLYNRLAGTETIGENAAAQTGAQGVEAANNAGNYLNQAGQAQAAGSMGISNAITGSANNAINQYQQQNYLDKLTGGGSSIYAPNSASVTGNTIMSAYG